MSADMHLMIDYDTASKPTEWGFLLSSQRRTVTPFKNPDRVISLFNTAVSPPRDGHGPAQVAHMQGEALRVARVLRQPAQPFYMHAAAPPSVGWADSYLPKSSYTVQTTDSAPLETGAASLPDPAR